MVLDCNFDYQKLEIFIFGGNFRMKKTLVTRAGSPGFFKMEAGSRAEPARLERAGNEPARGNTIRSAFERWGYELYAVEKSARVRAARAPYSVEIG